MRVEKSRLTFWAAVISTACVIVEYIVYRYRLSYLVSGDFATALGATLGMLIISPHIILFMMACIFTWVGYGADIRGLTLTGGILHAVALVFGLQNWYLMIAPIAMCFCGYAEQKRLWELADEMRNNPEATNTLHDNDVVGNSSDDNATHINDIVVKVLWLIFAFLVVCIIAVLVVLVTGMAF